MMNRRSFVRGALGLLGLAGGGAAVGFAASRAVGPIAPPRPVSFGDMEPYLPNPTWTGDSGISAWPDPPLTFAELVEMNRVYAPSCNRSMPREWFLSHGDAS